MKAMPIFLIGFMGSGKTTLGHALARRLHRRRFVDLDEEIEGRVGMSVSSFFAQHGEEAFRRVERDTLRELLMGANLIVGCGGGTPCFFDNMERMKAAGITVYLEASIPVLLRRLLEAQEQRPKLSGLTPEELERYIVDSLAEREPYYSSAAHRFSSDRLETPAEIEATCRHFITAFLSD